MREERERSRIGQKEKLGFDSFVTSASINPPPLPSPPEFSKAGARGLDFSIPVSISHWLLVSLGWSSNLPGKMMWLSQVSGRVAAVSCHQSFSRVAGGGWVDLLSRNLGIFLRGWNILEEEEFQPGWGLQSKASR